MSFYHSADSGSASSIIVDSSIGSSDDLNFYTFFGGILVPESNERAESLRIINEQIISAAREEKQRDSGGSAIAASPSVPAPSALLHAHLPTVLRLALTCPLEDIRTSMKDLLNELVAIDSDRYSKYVSALEWAFQPSNFVPISSCVDPTGQTPYSPVPTAAADQTDACGETSNLLVDIFLATGRTSHMDLLLAWHPSYLNVYTGCQHHLMDDAGPLDGVTRHYVAIMAAARHQCDVLIHLQETEYLLKGGDPTWLKGIAHAPKKLQSLCELNALLAHQPWLITRQHISALTAGGGSDGWSVAELVHAIVILSTFHALCGFVFGMGLKVEIDGLDWEAWDPSRAKQPAPVLRKQAAASDNASNPPTPHLAPHAAAAAAAAAASSPLQSAVSPAHAPVGAAKSAVSDGDQLLKLLASNADRSLAGGGDNINAFNEAGEELGSSPATNDTRSSASGSRGNVAELALGEGMSGHAASAASASSVSASMGGAGLGGLTSMLRHTHLDSSSPSSKFLLPQGADSNAFKFATMKYSNFDVNSKSYSTFFLHDYSWKEHGYALVNRYYLGFAQMLDAEFDLIFSLTYNTVSDAMNIDTTPFRRSIWYFTHRIFGCLHDDYDYNKLGLFLTQALKNYIRKIACAPETITSEDYQLAQYSFKPSEKAHIVLLTIEARRQASLLYALHSVMKHHTFIDANRQ